VLEHVSHRLLCVAHEHHRGLSREPTEPILPLALLTNSFGAVTSEPEINMPWGANSAYTFDLPVPLGPSSSRL
jgi:hypothetical protein